MPPGLPRDGRPDGFARRTAGGGWRDFGELESPDEVLCADCYSYRFDFPSGETLEYSQAPEPPAEIEPLLAELLTLLEANSPPNKTGA